MPAHLGYSGFESIVSGTDFKVSTRRCAGEPFKKFRPWPLPQTTIKAPTMNPKDTPALKPLTPEAKEALDGSAEIRLRALPFRIGRDSRTPIRNGWFGRSERREPRADTNNELYLLDTGRLKNVSREHCQIFEDRDEPGRYFLEDRGSVCGTIVGSRTVGGHRQIESCRLEHENVIVIGTQESPFAFQFCLISDAEPAGE